MVWFTICIPYVYVSYHMVNPSQINKYSFKKHDLRHLCNGDDMVQARRSDRSRYALPLDYTQPSGAWLSWDWNRHPGRPSRGSHAPSCGARSCCSSCAGPAGACNSYSPQKYCRLRTITPAHTRAYTGEEEESTGSLVFARAHIRVRLNIIRNL